MRSLTRAHLETRKKEVILWWLAEVPPVTAVISVFPCRAFNHRTRAFSHVKHGQARRHAPDPDRPSPVRRSSTGHRPAAHTCMCRRWLPRRRHRPDAAESTHTAIRPCTRRLAVREIFSLISALTRPSGPDTGIQISDLAASHNLEPRLLACIIAWGFSWIRWHCVAVLQLRANTVHCCTYRSICYWRSHLLLFSSCLC